MEQHNTNADQNYIMKKDFKKRMKNCTFAIKNGSKKKHGRADA